MFLNIFIYWISMLPFVVWGGLYEGPKIIYFLFGISGIILFWFNRVLKEKQNFELNKSDYFFLSFVIVLLISSIYGVHPFESVVGGSYRHQGAVFFVGLWLIGKTIQILSTGQKKLLSKTLGLVVLIEALFIITQYLTGRIYFGRPLGTIGESNAVFGFLVMGMYFVLNNFSKFYLIPLYIIVFVSSSRSAILSMIAFSGIFLVYLKSNFKKLVSIIMFIFIIATILYMSSNKTNSVVEDRSTLWKIAATEISKKPILGYGAESGEFLFNKVFLAQDIYLENIIIDRSHNLFLDILMWSGILGLVSFGGWFFFSFLGLDSPQKKFAFLSFLTYSMFQPLSIVHWILLIIIINI